MSNSFLYGGIWIFLMIFLVLLVFVLLGFGIKKLFFKKIPDSNYNERKKEIRDRWRKKK